MKSIARTVSLLFLAWLVFGAGQALAIGDGTPDESPPAEEAVCDEAGLMGAALGLCVAFCEANDCDTHPNSHACEVLRGNYARITGELAFPCELIGPPK